MARRCKRKQEQSSGTVFSRCHCRQHAIQHLPNSPERPAATRTVQALLPVPPAVQQQSFNSSAFPSSSPQLTDTSHRTPRTPATAHDPPPPPPPPPDDPRPQHELRLRPSLLSQHHRRHHADHCHNRHHSHDVQQTDPLQLNTAAEETLRCRRSAAASLAPGAVHSGAGARAAAASAAGASTGNGSSYR